MNVKAFARTIALGVAALVSAPQVAAADPGLYGGVQWLMLAPKVNSDGFQRVFYDGVDFATTTTDGDFEDDLENGVRVVLGSENCCGFGGRVRYFRYDNDIAYDGLWDAGAGTIPVQGNSNITVDAVDVEATQRANWCCWNLLVSGGLRYGSVDFTQPPGFFGGIPAVIRGGQTGVDFEGVGPTVALGASRCVGNGLSVVGQARTALLFGDIDINSGFRPANRTIQDEFTQVWEFQLGLNYQTRLNGRDVTAGVFWEAQRWDSDSNFIGDLALHGLGLSGGVSF